VGGSDANAAEEEEEEDAGSGGEGEENGGKLARGVVHRARCLYVQHARATRRIQRSRHRGGA